jgi:hypothetical protein
MDFRRQAPAAGRVEGLGHIRRALWRFIEVRVHGANQLIEADLAAMEGVE